MSKSDTFENDWMKLVFNNTAIAGIGDASGLQPSAAAGSLYLSLHVGDPGETGDQTTNETAYTGYARKAVARTTGGFTVTGNSVSPVADQDFPACTASPGSDITHWAIGTAASGAGKRLYSGAITPNIAMTVGTIPRIAKESTETED
jgi:hypothetical protein